MNNQTLKEVREQLKKGGTYFDTLKEVAIQAVVDAISRSPLNASLDIAKAIGTDAATQFLNHWAGGQDAAVQEVDPNNPLQKSLDGTPATIIHPSKEDDHEIPASVTKLTDGEIPPAPPGVPEAFTPEEEARIQGLTSSPRDAEFIQDLNDKAKAKEEKDAKSVEDKTKAADATEKEKKEVKSDKKADKK